MRRLVMLGMPILFACRDGAPRQDAASRPRVPGFMARQPAPGDPESFTFPLAEPLRLPGGMHGLLLERQDLPLVRLRLMVGSGTARDPGDRPGLAYATCQMLDEGAGARSALELSDELMLIGASLSLAVDGDTSAVTLHLLRQHLDRGLDLLADLIRRPRFPAGEWSRVREELEARAQQRRSHPSKVGHLALKAAVFGKHPYQRPALPLPGQLARLGVQDLRRFHREHFRPDNMLVVVAGAVSARELEQQIAARFAPPRRAVKAAPRGRLAADRPAPPPDRGPRLVLVDRPGATQSVLKVGHLGPAARAQDLAILKVLNTILGGSFTSRLNQNLRERHGFTYGIRSSFTLSRDVGLFAISTSVETKDTLAALKEILIEVSRLQARPVGQAELRKAQQLIIEALPATAETLVGLVEAFGDLVSLGFPPDELRTLPARVAAVTPAALQRLARRLLRPGQATLVVVGDLARLEAPLVQAYGPARRTDADGQLAPQQKARPSKRGAARAVKR